MNSIARIGSITRSNTDLQVRKKRFNLRGFTGARASARVRNRVVKEAKTSASFPGPQQQLGAIELVLKFISCVDLTAQQTCTERATELLSERLKKK